MLFISEVARILCIDKCVVMKLLQLFLQCNLNFLYKKFNFLFDTLLVQDGLICDDVGWWSGFNKCVYGVENVDIGLFNIMEGTGTNNKVAPSRGAMIGSFIIVVYGVRIL